MTNPAIHTAIQAAIEAQPTAQVARTTPQRMHWSANAAMLLIAATIGSTSIAAVAGATPLISEVYYDAVGSDNGQTFVENCETKFSTK